MANYTFNIGWLSFNNTIIISSSDSTGLASNSRMELYEGDTVTFTRTGLGTGNTVSVISFSSNYWTSTSNISLTNSGNTVVKTVKNSPTIGTFELAVTKSGTPSKTLYFRTLTSADTTPNSYSIGSDKVANPSQVTYFNSVTVTGINSATPASIINGEIALQSGSAAERTFGSSKTVSNNDVLLVRATAPSGYSQSKTVTLNIGGIYDAALLSTPSDPTSGTQINLGISSGTIDMDSILDLFMGQNQGFWGYTRPSSMSDLYKSGTYVPNITANNSIPSSGQISLSNFYNSATSYYIASNPANKSVFIDTSTGSSSYTGSLYWELGVDWDIGYGIGQRYNTELYYVVTQNVGSVTVSAGSTYNVINHSIAISKTVSGNTEEFNSGTITIYVRSLVDNSVTATTTMNYAINFFGP